MGNIFTNKLQEDRKKNAISVEEKPVDTPVETPVEIVEEIPTETPIVDSKKSLLSGIFGNRKKQIETTEEIKKPDVVVNTQLKNDIFINTYHDPNVIVRKSSNQSYEKINTIDLVNIRQEYDIILTSSPSNQVSKQSMFFNSTPKITKGKNVIFDNFNLSVKDVVGRGQFVTILGKSGCGKSTILRYICGLQKPTSGEIYLHGKKLLETDRIPMVFQQYSSFPWKTVLENVALPLILKKTPKKEAFEKAMEMIKIVGLEGQESKFAKMPNLSGGQLQRVAIARNLVADPTILLMDEPFGALDIVTRRSMQVFLRKMFQENNGFDPTVLLVTHDIREAIFLSTDIYILDANPANVRCHIEVDLPNIRENSIKREPKFLEYVNYIEDMMEKIEKEK